ncbi:MAG: hypothetical protein U0470_07965 [Anaerolineae bacterium]
MLSQGHAAPILYAALAQAGMLLRDELLDLRTIGSRLEGHPNMRRVPGVEASTGSLGCGLSVGLDGARRAPSRARRPRLRAARRRRDRRGPGLGGGDGWRRARPRRAGRDHHCNGYQQMGAADGVMPTAPLAAMRLRLAHPRDRRPRLRRQAGGPGTPLVSAPAGRREYRRHPAGGFGASGRSRRPGQQFHGVPLKPATPSARSPRSNREPLR